MLKQGTERTVTNSMLRTHM